jgi:stalled ribosome rescue protein Dom34
MKKKVGLWIDHRKAVIVFLASEEEEIKVIKSNVEKQIQRAATSRSGGPFESQAVPSDDRQERAFTKHLNIYYNEVISCIRDAESILIFGPGEAKGELKKHLEREGLGGSIIGVETVDEMTDPQIAAKARQYFLNLT